MSTIRIEEIPDELRRAVIGQTVRMTIEAQITDRHESIEDPTFESVVLKIGDLEILSIHGDGTNMAFKDAGSKAFRTMGTG